MTTTGNNRLQCARGGFVLATVLYTLLCSGNLAGDETFERTELPGFRAASLLFTHATGTGVDIPYLGQPTNQR